MPVLKREKIIRDDKTLSVTQQRASVPAAAAAAGEGGEGGGVKGGEGGGVKGEGEGDGVKGEGEGDGVKTDVRRRRRSQRLSMKEEDSAAADVINNSMAVNDNDSMLNRDALASDAAAVVKQRVELSERGRLKPHGGWVKDEVRSSFYHSVIVLRQSSVIFVTVASKCLISICRTFTAF